MADIPMKRVVIGSKTYEIVDEYARENIGENKDILMGLYPIETASGPIAVIHDGAESIPVRDLSVAIEPAQPLNGYDKPWAGGAGKNLLTPTAPAGTVNGITYTVNSDGSIKASGTATAQAVRDFYNGVTPASVGLADGEYILSGCPSGGSNDKYALRVVTTKASGNTTVSDYGSGATFTIDSSVTAIRVHLYVGNGQTVNNIVFYPMIRKASETDATFEPYSNICPITGWDAVKVTRADGIVCEKNNSWANASGIVEASAPYVGCIFRCEQDKRYYYKFNGTAGHNIVVAFYTEYPNVGVRSYNGSRLANLPNNSSIVAPINGYGLIRNVVANPLINIGTVDSYEPMPEPVSDTHTITFPTEAGTVYGGTLDVTKGILTVTKGMIASYAGETLPGAWISDRDVYAAGATPTTGAQVVYDLASHQTYTLTPVQVKTLLGENRIYADAGRVTVQYRADFNEAGLMYIPKAPTADGSYRLTADVTGGTPTYRWEAE